MSNLKDRREAPRRPPPRESSLGWQLAGLILLVPVIAWAAFIGWAAWKLGGS